MCFKTPPGATILQGRGTVTPPLSMTERPAASRLPVTTPWAWRLPQFSVPGALGFRPAEVAVMWAVTLDRRPLRGPGPAVMWAVTIDRRPLRGPRHEPRNVQLEWRLGCPGNSRVELSA